MMDEFIAHACWMRHVPDDASVMALSIPGTHNSCCLHGLLGVGKTQELDLPDQLHAGIRLIYHVFECRGTDGTWLLEENKPTSQRLSCRILARTHWNYRDGLLRRTSRIGYQRDQSERHDGSDRRSRTVSTAAVSDAPSAIMFLHT
jgi:hypothetical protein